MKKQPPPSVRTIAWGMLRALSGGEHEVTFSFTVTRRTRIILAALTMALLINGGTATVEIILQLVELLGGRGGAVP